jgi:hypothetical protein
MGLPIGDHAFQDGSRAITGSARAQRGPGGPTRIETMRSLISPLRLTIFIKRRIRAGVISFRWTSKDRPSKSRCCCLSRALNCSTYASTRSVVATKEKAVDCGARPRPPL